MVDEAVSLEQYMQVSATGATWEPYVHCNKASAVEKGEKVELNTPGLYRLYRVYCDFEIQLFPISLLKNNIDQPWLRRCGSLGRSLFCCRLAGNSV